MRRKRKEEEEAVEDEDEEEVYLRLVAHGGRQGRSAAGSMHTEKHT